MTTVPKNKRTTFFIMSLIMLAGICATVFAVSLKKGMHVDEYYSYGLSNYSGDDIFMHIDLGKTYDDPAKPFLDYMAVQPGNGSSGRECMGKTERRCTPPTLLRNPSYCMQLFFRQNSAYGLRVSSILLFSAALYS